METTMFNQEPFSILIIDDNQEQNNIIKKILISLNFSIDQAFTGQEGLVHIESDPPEMILLDVNLPDINGFELLKTIRAMPSAKNCMVIMISSAFVESMDQSQGLELGADGYIILPIPNRELSARIRAFVRHKKTINQLRIAEKQFRTMLQNSNEGILMVNAEGKIIFANKASERFFAKKTTQLLNLNFGMPMIDGENTTIDITLDKEILTVQMKQTEVLIEGQKGWIISLNDITPFRETEESMKSKIDTLLTKEQDQDKMFSIIAHDLKNPFNSLLNFSELLIQDNRNFNQEEIKHYLAIINASAKKIFDLLLNLLDWSRLQIGHFHNTPKEIDLKLFASNLVDLFKEMAEAKNIPVQIAIEPGMTLITDENILHTILRNILTNALKFTPRDGLIKIDAESGPEIICLRITDSGIGMTEEKIRAIFDKNHFGEKTHKESGTGLGLMLCQELISRIGGKLEISSNYGYGTTVSCLLKTGRSGSYQGDCKQEGSPFSQF